MESYGWYSVGFGVNGDVCGFRNAIGSVGADRAVFTSVEVPFEFAYARLPEFIGVRCVGVMQSVTARDMKDLENYARAVSHS